MIEQNFGLLFMFYFIYIHQIPWLCVLQAAFVWSWKDSYVILSPPIQSFVWNLREGKHNFATQI